MFKKLKTKRASVSRRSLPKADSGSNKSTQFSSAGKPDNKKKIYYCPSCGHELNPESMFCLYDGLGWSEYSVYARYGLTKRIMDKLDMSKAEGASIFDFIYGTHAGQLYAIMIFEQGKDYYVIAGQSENNQTSQVAFAVPGDEIGGFEEIWMGIGWEKQYGRKSLGAVVYGCNWGLRVRYKDTNILAEGYDEYPKNFKSTVRSLYLFIEKLRKTYDRDSIGSSDFEVGKIIQGPFALAGSLPFCSACGRHLKPDQVICECGRSRYNDDDVPRIIEPLRKREDIFYFSYGTIHGDQVDYRIIKRPDGFQVVLDSRSRMHVSFMVPEKRIRMLEPVWKNLRWSENYMVLTPPTPGGVEVLDGIIWRLEIAYHDFRMNSYGRFDAPPDFDSFRMDLEKRLKELQDEYGDRENTFNFDRDQFGCIISKGF